MRNETTPQTLIDAVKAYQEARAIDATGRQNGRTFSEYEAHRHAVTVARQALLDIARTVKL